MANAFAVGGEGGAGRSVGDDDEEFAALKTLGGEVQPERAGGIVADQRGPEGADAATFPQQRAQGEATAVLCGHDELLLHADGERDIVFVEEVHPFDPDELPIREQEPDARGTEDRQVTLHQPDARGGVAAAAVVVEHAPHQRRPRPPRDHRQHQDVDVARAELPLGTVKRQMPRPDKSQEPDHQRRRPIRSETDMLEEPLQPTVGRGDLRRRRPLAGKMTEVDRAGADHTDDEQAQRLQPALAQSDMRPQDLLEGGNGTVMHRAILWSESSRQSPPAALSYPCVVQRACTLQADGAGRSRRALSVADFSWPQAAMMSSPRGRRTGLE